MAQPHSYEAFVLQIGQWLMKNYWGPLWRRVKDHPELLRTFPGFLVEPQKQIYYMGRTHIGIEYVGPERLTRLIESEIDMVAQCFDYSLKECNLLEQIVGFDYGNEMMALPLGPFTQDLILPTNNGFDELQRLNWNWAAQEMIVGFNTGCVMAPEGQFTRLVNARFFDADAGGLRTRHIKWLDLIPCRYDDSGSEVDSFEVHWEPYRMLASLDASATYPLPDDFRLERLQTVNRFIEFIGNRNCSEPEITRLLASEQFRFILKMRFGAQDVYAEQPCEWQSSQKQPLRPDFFVVGTDGFADIVEFKLPWVKSAIVVGTSNRETFSAEINSYVSQTRVYREYFDDPRNRDHVQSLYGFKVYKPKRYLVIGRRWDLNNEEWRAIAADFTDLNILTYDDVIDGVVTQFYG